MNSYVIRKYNQKDIVKIVDLWRRNEYFKGVTPQILKKHLLWKYKQKFTKVWIAEKNTDIIGSCGMIIYPLLVSGKNVINGNWGIDSLVDKKLNRKNRGFIFFRVFRSVLLEDYRKNRPCLGFCFPNEVIRNTYLKIGWIDVPVFSHFIKNISSMSYKRKDIHKDFSFEGIELLLIKKFNRKWDSLWKELCSKYSLISLRNSHYLNWRYFECPDKEYFVFLGKDKNNIKGYIILREDIMHKIKHGYIIDFLVNSNDKRLFEIFIMGVLLFFRNRGIRFVHSYTSDMTYKAVLLKLGFRPVKKIDFFTLGLGKDKKLWKQALKNKDYWFVTAGDGDFELE